MKSNEQRSSDPSEDHLNNRHIKTPRYQILNLATKHRDHYSIELSSFLSLSDLKADIIKIRPNSIIHIDFKEKYNFNENWGDLLNLDLLTTLDRFSVKSFTVQNKVLNSEVFTTLTDILTDHLRIDDADNPSSCYRGYKQLETIQLYVSSYAMITEALQKFTSLPHLRYLTIKYDLDD